MLAAACSALPSAGWACRPERFATRPAHAPRLSSYVDCYRVLRTACRAAMADRAGEWLASADAAAAAGGGRSLPALLDDLQASAELQELCRLQLALLTSALELSLQAVLTSSVAGSVSESMDEETFRQQLLAESGCLRASVYFRAPASLQTGQLQLQLVAASDGAAGMAAQQAQRFLFLGAEGMGGSSLGEQERWILEQPVIVLPDSGGLVLPLAHNGFLVGLLVVERCTEEEDEKMGGSSPASSSMDAADGGAASGSTAGGEGEGGRMPHAPPACLLFRSAELQLLKQAAAVLALACAMDLRAALERAGAAYRQRQASALVQAAKKPLGTLRTLGTMLLPRLQPGEPDRDFAQGILEQGNRLQEVVSQLQAALHPGAMGGAMLPGMQAGSGGTAAGAAAAAAGGGGVQLSSRSRMPVGSGEWQLAEQPRPALPSSSIGSDYQWGPSSPSSGPTIDISDESPDAAGSRAAERAAAAAASAPGSGASSSNGASSSSGSSSSGSSSAAIVGMSAGGSRASADLLNVLMPLLASASNFATVSGVSFVMVDQSSSSGSASSSGSSSGGASAGGRLAPLSLPAAEVAVGPGKLKRMLSQLIDSIIACAARGDLVQASVTLQQWAGRPGVAVTLCCWYGLQHGGAGGGARLQPEFAFLQGSAAGAGGYFEVHTEPAPDVRHLNSSALAATLWLPTVEHDAGWP